MNRSVSAVLGALTLAFALPGFAHEFTKGDLFIGHPWTRATANGQSVAAGYLEVRNAGKAADRFIGATTPAAERIELHVIVTEGAVMKMRQVEFFAVPARGKVELKPRGPHLMIVGIKRPFKKGERVPVKLRFEKAGDLDIELAVDAIDAKLEHRH